MLDFMTVRHCFYILVLNAFCITNATDIFHHNPLVYKRDSGILLLFLKVSTQWTRFYFFANFLQYNVHITKENSTS